MITVILSVFITNKKLFLHNLLYITIPTILVALITFWIMFILNVKIWYYHLDAGLAEVFFFIIIISCLVNTAKHVEEVKLKNIFFRLIFPVIVGSGGYIFAQIYLSSRFKVADNTEQYLIRLLYYPFILEVSLILQEYCYRTFDGGTNISNHGRAHFIFLTQVSFGILGQYMTTTSGSLMEVTVYSACQFLKDVAVHRLSWQQCYIAHKFKRLIPHKFKLLFGIEDGEEDFDTWFYSPNFQEFRACVFNNDFILEVTGKKKILIHILDFDQKIAFFTIFLARLYVMSEIS